MQGSTHDRTAGPMDEQDTKTVWKDLDLDMAIKLPKELHERCVTLNPNPPSIKLTLPRAEPGGVCRARCARPSGRRRPPVLARRGRC